LRIWGLGCGEQGSGFRVHGSGFRDYGSGFRVQTRLWLTLSWLALAILIGRTRERTRGPEATRERQCSFIACYLLPLQDLPESPYTYHAQPQKLTSSTNLTSSCFALGRGWGLQPHGWHWRSQEGESERGGAHGRGVVRNRPLIDVESDVSDFRIQGDSPFNTSNVDIFQHVKSGPDGC